MHKSYRCLSATIRVLLIEDDMFMANMLIATLSKSNIAQGEIIWVSLLSKGLEQIKSNQFDVVLLDLSLPDSHSLETLVKVRNCAPQMPIVVLSNLDNQDIALEALKMGAQDYLIKGKPSPDSICRALLYAIERKRSEDLFISGQLNAKRLAVLEQREQFIAMLSHDLKVPLIGIERILSSLMAADLNKVTSDQLLDLFSKMKNSNQSTLLMINNVLDAYRIESGAEPMTIGSVCLKRLALECIQEILPLAAGKKLNISQQITDIGNVLADQFAMRRVLINLLSNAVKFTPENGDIEITIEDIDNKAVLRISDTGIGMNQEELERVFDRFWQSQKKYRGMGLGLGLSLSKQLVESQDGTITVESNKETGTTFQVILPHARCKQPSILIVDDTYLSRHALKTLLGRLKMDADSVNSGEQALNAVKQKDYAAIFMDLNMPNMDGFSTTHNLRIAGVQIPIIAYSANPLLTNEPEKVLQAGFNDMVQKPAAKSQLQDILNRVLGNPNISEIAESTNVQEGNLTKIY